jgi:hypothetical protein
MKITFGSVTISGGGKESPADCSLEGVRVIQLAQRLRAAGITPLYRQNRQNTFSGTVTREHATTAAAETFLLTHENSLPDQDTLTIKSDADATLLTISNAVCVLCRTRYKGSSTITTYQFVGGVVTEPEPAP